METVTGCLNPPQRDIPAAVAGASARRGYTALVVAFASFLIGCSSDRPPDGRIRFRNDLRDREYNVITVAGTGISAALKPDQSVLLPKGIRTFSVRRRYATSSRSYTVSCPPLKGRGIVIKLIDVHLNRMQGGCVTTDAARQ